VQIVAEIVISGFFEFVWVIMLEVGDLLKVLKGDWLGAGVTLL
jgi:hypothetical protein